MTLYYTKQFDILSQTLEKFIDTVHSKKSTQMATDEWTVKDMLGHITFWHENYAANYKALAQRKDPPLPEDMSTINTAGALLYKKYSTKELVSKLRNANKSLYRSIVVKKVPRMTYSKGGRVYETLDFLETVVRHIETHTKQVKKAK